ncbi:MAG: hypothetical protein A4E24_00128 [Methanomethylovorans sp. PtaU1.Bin093]|uniref:DUF1638 domain-containing protein n=2 Tax=Methanomethylovorans TaxID=101191 RepID=UPI0009D4E7B8|nr:DUF1638 domain-containing protein [Methanomethylovorans sp. PtaU1.Bin093]OPY22086.1 MAG: hypothetical protein A4E24_00128 [Methanomethylovorans sp. PtaU1.Bin093]
MPVMSIIACRILEEELFHVISLENAFDYLLVTDTKEAQGLSRRLKAVNVHFASVPEDKMPEMLQQTRSSCKSNIIRRLLTNKPPEDFILVVHVLELGLHRDLTLLRRGVYAAVEQMSAYSDGILLFYGLCGNSLQNIEKDLSHIRCPIYLLRDGESNRVDDCISIALGGNRQYEEAFELCRGNGTLFFTPMWASNWKDLDAPGNKQEDMETICDSFKRHHISRIVKIEKGTLYDPAFEENIKRLADMFGLEIISMTGNAEIVERCYLDAKSAIKSVCK